MNYLLEHRIAEGVLEDKEGFMTSIEVETLERDVKILNDYLDLIHTGLPEWSRHTD